MCVGQLGSGCAAGGFVFCVCGTVVGVSVQHVALCCECGTVGGVKVQQVVCVVCEGQWWE